MGRQKLVILGATGSIGVSTLDVVARHPERYEVLALTACRQIERLYEQCCRFNPQYAALASDEEAERLSGMLRRAGCMTTVLAGSESMVRVASLPEADAVMAAIVGAAGLGPTYAAVKAGKKVLLANKESLVMAGPVFMSAVNASSALILPIDSEHNAIFQSLQNDISSTLEEKGVRRIVLTASGGPFRQLPIGALDAVTPDQACAHPNWVMGRKISVDSATMMNKGLEVIEAHWLFHAPRQMIEVLIHPQSVVHSMVEYADGSVIAQLGNPDMRTPIAHALAYPERIDAGVASLDLCQIGNLTFEAIDYSRFPCLGLAYEALERGGNAPAVLNAANEVAVAAFLTSELGFTRIPTIIQQAMSTVPQCGIENLDDVMAADAEARAVARKSRCGIASLASMSNFLFYLGAFALALGLLIVVHEAGHFVVARWCGVKVLRFSIGFGSPLISRRYGKDQTELALAAFPLGGYVKMLDEREGEVSSSELARAFNRQPVWKRFAIVLAGPVANFALAVLMYWTLFVHGVEEPRPILGKPAAQSLAERAGFQEAERILGINGKPTNTWQELRWELLQLVYRNESIAIEVINPRNEIAVRRLDLTSVKTNDLENDLLNQFGFRYYRPRLLPVIGRIEPGGAADLAGMREGDLIQSIDDTATETWTQVVAMIREAPGRLLRISVARRGQILILNVIPSEAEDHGKTVGRIGIAVKEEGVDRATLMVTVRYDIIDGFGKALIQTWETSAFSFRMLGKIVVGEVSWKNLSGPVTIADYAGQSAMLGMVHYIKFLALISISLGVLNLLPIPLLDGGHLMYYIVEIIKGGPVSERAMEIGQRIGLGLLVLLMAFAFYNDINRLISG